MIKYTTRIPSDMMKNINEMKFPRATKSGEVKTLMILPSKIACPGLTAAGSDRVVSKCSGRALLFSAELESGVLPRTQNHLPPTIHVAIVTVNQSQMSGVLFKSFQVL